MWTGIDEFQAFAATMQRNPDDRDLHIKVKRACNGINETIHMIANDPSLGMYRVQQHVKKSLPKVVNSDNELKASNSQLQGLVYDASYADEAIQSIRDSIDCFTNMEKLLREATSNAAVIKMKKSSPHVL